MVRRISCCDRHGVLRRSVSDYLGHTGRIPHSLDDEEIPEPANRQSGTDSPCLNRRLVSGTDSSEYCRDQNRGGTKLLARRTEKLNLFLEYTHLVLGPYVSAEGLERLRDCIASYAHEEALPTDLIPVRVEKLTNFDLFHFGWNMAEYFGIGKKYEVVPWLQQVFANLRELEPSYIKGSSTPPRRSVSPYPIQPICLPFWQSERLTNLHFEISERFSEIPSVFGLPEISRFICLGSNRTELENPCFTKPFRL